VRELVCGHEVLEIQMRIDLGGRYAGMTQEILDCPNVSAGLEQVCRRGMPEHVRVDVHLEPLVLCRLGDAWLHDSRLRRSAPKQNVLSTSRLSSSSPTKRRKREVVMIYLPLARAVEPNADPG